MSPNQKPFHNPFGALGALRDRLGPIEEPPGRMGAAPAAKAPAKPSIPRAIVRMERSGRRGKEATIVEHLNLDAAEREAWLVALKSALGCGGSLEGEALMLQGDHRKRLPALLTARGVKKVTVG